MTENYGSSFIPPDEQSLIGKKLYKGQYTNFEYISVAQ